MTIRSDNENEILHNFLKQQEDKAAWIGATKTKTEDVWRWGRGGDQIKSNYWAPEEPYNWNSYADEYAEINASNDFGSKNNWRNFLAQTSRSYFCETLTEAELNRHTEEEATATTVENTTTEKEPTTTKS